MRRWCELRPSEDKTEFVMDFFLDSDDVEPTKRIHLMFARVITTDSSRLTQAQLSKVSGRVGGAFFIDFPAASYSHHSSPLYVETRSLKLEMAADDFPLGFIMVSAETGAANLWERSLKEGCKISVPREKKRERLQRWVNRAWLRLRGDLSLEQFDETFRPMPSSTSLGDEDKNFFTVVEKIDQEDNDSEMGSFQTADDDEDEDLAFGRESLSPVGKRKIPDASSLSSSKTHFSTIEEMLDETRDEIRHQVPISEAEIASAVEYVEKTRVFSLDTTNSCPKEWSKCSEGETFDCFKSVDELSGLVRTRTWAKIANVPPQCLFHILYDNAARKNWDHHYVKFETVSQQSRDLDILDAIVGAPFGCANREFMEWRRRMVTNNEKFVIYLRSWSGSACRAVLKGNVRAEVWLSIYLVQWWRDTEGNFLGSEVMVMSQVDIKGLIPRYLVNALSASAPKRWVKSVTNAAHKELEERGIANRCMRMHHSELDALYKIHL